MINRIKNAIPIRAKYPIRMLIGTILRLIKYRNNFRGKQSGLIHLSDGNNPTFFGYHDKTPFSGDGTKILAMSIAIPDTKPDGECTTMKLGYFAKNQSENFDNTFHSFSETNTWCWQQGCMMQWHPIHNNTQVFYNKLLNNSYGSEIFDITNKKIIRRYNHPIYSLNPTGKAAVSLNFSRLGRLRPGYGYPLLPDRTEQIKAPEDDGLFVFDTAVGERRLLINLNSLSKDVKDYDHHHYINHATFSPDGERLVFFHLWGVEKGKWKGLRFCEADLNTGGWHVIESKRIVSHYCWRDPDTILATVKENNGPWNYVLYDLRTRQLCDLGLPLKKDGHPMYHPKNKNIFVTDTYPDFSRDQQLNVINISTTRINKLGPLFSPFKFFGIVRCDLHPRWDRDGRYVLVDDASMGRRQLLVFEIESSNRLSNGLDL